MTRLSGSPGWKTGRGTVGRHEQFESDAATTETEMTPAG